MTEQERYTIEKDLVNEKLCIWDYDDLICEVDDDKALITLVNLLNKLNKKKRELKERNQELELENLKYIGEGEWDIRDITCMHGKFRLEEWGERYHQFYEGNKQLEDEEVVSLLFENEQLKHELLCKQLDKAPTYPINCKCYYKELQE